MDRFEFEKFDRQLVEVAGVNGGGAKASVLQSFVSQQPSLSSKSSLQRIQHRRPNFSPRKTTRKLQSHHIVQETLSIYPYPRRQLRGLVQKCMSLLLQWTDICSDVPHSAFPRSSLWPKVVVS